MEFKHRITGKPVMYISESNLFPQMKHRLISESMDLPDLNYGRLGIPESIFETQGRSGVWGWMLAFLDNGIKEFYLFFFETGFPDGKLPDGLK